MSDDDRALLKSIATIMMAQAGPCRPSCRELPGGLIVRYFASDGSRQLTLTSPHPGPTMAQRETLRAAFEVPGTAFEIKQPLETHTVVSLEWEIVSQLSGNCKATDKEAA